MAKTARITWARNDQYRITIPRALVEGLQWKKGDRIAFRIEGKNKLLMVKAEELVKG